MPPNPWTAALLLAALVGTAGCGRTPDEPAASPGPSSAGEPALAGQALDATWEGVLPCADCDGIQTRLRLLANADGRRFELQEAYLAADGGEQFQAQGEWSEASVEINGAPARVYGLDVDGAARWFALGPDGSLEQLESRDRAGADGQRQRLQRQ